MVNLCLPIAMADAEGATAPNSNSPAADVLPKVRLVAVMGDWV